jgi:hypothetical protein
VLTVSKQLDAAQALVKFMSFGLRQFSCRVRLRA